MSEPRRVSAYCWLYEYSGNDSSWKCYRTTFVYTKKRRVACPAS